ncbi:RraA family protein [Salinicola corii]|uniref:Putative 4-hydroxy-4-methyl-2-oxoglutarate aldolase n=1 Tax=Salinicola corii TaxID=2606937 RepID=A0A640WF97_9GAMM|nr:RraA family protein [Salinicola corii]KAA0018825.1 RraA family protein [Salinicola corii]
MTEGFRVKKEWSRIGDDEVRRAKLLPVSNISDVMSRRFGAPAGLRAMHRGGKMAGPALTVSVRPGDNLMLHKALVMAQPGDVIVVDAGGALDNAIIGELMLARGVQAGIAGIVIWGAIRDAGSIAQQDVPVFASGVSHRGPYKDGPGEIGFPIAVGNMLVNPGDLIVGDEDGILAIPREQASVILTRAEGKHHSEEQQLQTTLQGKYDATWIDDALKELGCEFTS